MQEIILQANLLPSTEALWRFAVVPDKQLLYRGNTVIEAIFGHSLNIPFSAILKKSKFSRSLWL